MIEADVEAKCIDLALRAGYETRKLQWVGRRSAPDRVFFGLGRFVLVEFKVRGVRLKGLQRREFRRLRRAHKDVWAVWEVETFRAIMNIPEHIQ